PRSTTSVAPVTRTTSPSPNAGVASPPGAGRRPNRPVTAWRRRASTWTATCWRARRDRTTGSSAAVVTGSAAPAAAIATGGPAAAAAPVAAARPGLLVHGRERRHQLGHLRLGQLGPGVDEHVAVERHPLGQHVVDGLAGRARGVVPVGEVEPRAGPVDVV